MDGASFRTPITDRVATKRARADWTPNVSESVIYEIACCYRYVVVFYLSRFFPAIFFSHDPIVREHREFGPRIDPYDTRIGPSAAAFGPTATRSDTNNSRAVPRRKSQCRQVDTASPRNSRTDILTIVLKVEIRKRRDASQTMRVVVSSVVCPIPRLS